MGCFDIYCSKCSAPICDRREWLNEAVVVTEDGQEVVCSGHDSYGNIGGVNTAYRATTHVACNGIPAEDLRHRRILLSKYASQYFDMDGAVMGGLGDLLEDPRTADLPAERLRHEERLSAVRRRAAENLRSMRAFETLFSREETPCRR
jgi:hypothetical protein